MKRYAKHDSIAVVDQHVGFGGGVARDTADLESPSEQRMGRSSHLDRLDPRAGWVVGQGINKRFRSTRWTTAICDSSFSIECKTEFCFV